MPAWQSSRRTGSALAPAGFAFLLAVLAAASGAGLARADTVVSPVHRSYLRAYVALGAGVGLTAASFVIADRADVAYARYLAETDPARIEDAFQDAKRLDRLSATALIAGQAGLALGIYWRFLRHPHDGGRIGATVDPAASPPATAWSVAPTVTPRGVGIALDVRF